VQVENWNKLVKTLWSASPLGNLMDMKCQLFEVRSFYSLSGTTICVAGQKI